MNNETETAPADDGLDVPPFLRIENRKPLKPEQQKKVDEVMAKAKTAAKAKPVHKSAKPKPKPESKLRPDGLREGSSGAKLVDFVCRAKGATNEELCNHIGWKQCLPYLKKSCDQAGVKLRTERKEGELTRYFGTRKGAAKKKPPAE